MQRDFYEGARGRAWVAHSDAPGAAIRVRADHGKIAAEVDEPVASAEFSALRSREIGGVLLHVAAEIELHARERQDDARRAPGELVPTN